MDYFINRLVVYIFLLQLVIGLGLGFTGDVLGMTIDSYFYLGYAHDVPKPWYNWIIIPLRFTLLCSLMIPQSLKVTSDICKYCSSLFIGWDVKMYDTTTNTPAEAIKYVLILK
jgi:phospholipid-translocating ATPase